MPTPPPLTDPEWKIMNIVWELEEATAREVLARLDVDWAYTTVKTMMARLVAKGVLRETKRSNVGVYSARVRRGTAQRKAVRDLLDRAFDGAFGSMVAFFASNERLSARDQERLRQLLVESDRDLEAEES
ncbi:MAG: BlaI/MecI/CopY family transcriptional regulator [Planctomycetes bacterium]|nr:BlaI/MecI/CopY family transcriptional regulator [Planctomycetota bacterium]